MQYVTITVRKLNVVDFDYYGKLGTMSFLDGLFCMDRSVTQMACAEFYIPHKIKLMGFLHLHNIKGISTFILRFISQNVRRYSLDVMKVVSSPD